MKLHGTQIFSALAGLALVATLSFASPAIAGPGQGGGHGRGDHAQKFEKMQAELGLTPDQTARIKTIMDANKEEMKLLHEQMRNTFTPAQQAQMKSARENGEKGKRPSREERKANWDQMGVSDGQRQQLKSYREQIKTKRESIRSQINAVLTPEQQQKMAAMKSEHRGKRGKGGDGGKRGGAQNTKG